MTNIRRHIFFFGRVQGVGFRYTCKSVAERHEVVGWVRNLNDRSVEMIVEGDAKTISRYVDDIRESTHGRVDDIQSSDLDSTGEFNSMEIRH